MRTSVFFVAAILAFSLGGCDGTAVEDDGAGVAQAPSAAVEDAAEQPGEEDVFKQWGPDKRPDRKAEPLQFFYWRIDKMFTDSDANQDGKLAFEEFAGELPNFKRIDKNGDGFLTKQEVVDDGAHRVVEPGGVSEP